MHRRGSIACALHCALQAVPVWLGLRHVNDAQVQRVHLSGIGQQVLCQGSIALHECSTMAGSPCMRTMRMMSTSSVCGRAPAVGTPSACVLSHAALMSRGLTAARPDDVMLVPDAGIYARQGLGRLDGALAPCAQDRRSCTWTRGSRKPVATCTNREESPQRLHILSSSDATGHLHSPDTSQLLQCCQLPDYLT